MKLTLIAAAIALALGTSVQAADTKQLVPLLDKVSVPRPGRVGRPRKRPDSLRLEETDLMRHCNEIDLGPPCLAGDLESAVVVKAAFRVDRVIAVIRDKGSSELRDINNAFKIG